MDTTVENGIPMDVIVEKECGLDVHKETVVSCIMGKGIKVG